MSFLRSYAPFGREQEETRLTPCPRALYAANIHFKLSFTTKRGGGKNLRTNSFFSFSGQKSVRFGTKADAVCNGQEREYYGGKPLTYAKTP